MSDRDILCSIENLLKQVVILLGGSPSPALAPRYTVAGRLVSVGTGMSLVVPANPKRANLVLINDGPGDIFIDGAPGGTGAKVVVGLVLGFPGITEPIYARATVANTALYYIEVVEVSR